MTTPTKDDALVDLGNELLDAECPELPKLTVLLVLVEMVEIQLARIKRFFPATFWIAASIVEGDAVADHGFPLSFSFHSVGFLLPMLGVVVLVVCPTSRFVVLIVLLGIGQSLVSCTKVILPIAI